MKKFALFTVLLLSFSLTIMAQSVTGSTSNLQSSLLNKLRQFAVNTKRDLYVRSGDRTANEQQVLWDEGLARGGHISSDHATAVRNGSNCTITTTGGNAVHAPRVNGNGWMEIARPGRSKHQTGEAADVDGISWSDCSALNRVGLRHTVPTESWHVEEGSSCTH
jgi:hypothetical protein